MPQVVEVVVHQCMAGLIGPRSGLPMKKPTEFWASDEALVIQKLKCDGRRAGCDLGTWRATRTRVFSEL